MLAAYKEMNNHNAAIKFFTEIISTYNLQPTVDTYNILIDMCAVKVRLDPDLTVLNAIRNQF